MQFLLLCGAEMVAQKISVPPSNAVLTGLELHDGTCKRFECAWQCSLDWCRVDSPEILTLHSNIDTGD